MEPLLMRNNKTFKLHTAPFIKNNKCRTNLLLMAHSDVKDIMRNSSTKINSKRLNDYVSEFESVVVKLKEETFISNNNENGITKLSDKVNSNKPKYNFECCPGGILKRGFDFRKRRTTISGKKIEYFNKKVLRAQMDKTEEYELLRQNIDYDNGMRSISKRKVSIIRLREKLQEEHSNKKYEIASQGYDFLNNLCSSLKLKKSLFKTENKKKLVFKNDFFEEYENIKPRINAKSCDKKNVKILSDLYSHLQDNIHHPTSDQVINQKIVRSEVRHNTFNKCIKLKSQCKVNEIKEESPKDKETSDEDSLRNLRTDSFGANNLSPSFNADSLYSSYESNKLMRNSLVLDESMYEKDFKISMYKCSFSSQREGEKEYESNFYFNSSTTPKSFKDFKITLKTCKANRDDLETPSRKYSEVTPQSSLNEELL